MAHLFGSPELEFKELEGRCGWLRGAAAAPGGGGGEEGLLKRKPLRNLHTARRGYRTVPRRAQMPPVLEDWTTVLAGLPDCCGRITHTHTHVMNDLLHNNPPLICHFAQWLTGSRTMEALGASSSSSKVFSRSSAVNSRLGNIVAREKCPNLLPTSCGNRVSYSYASVQQTFNTESTNFI